MPDDVILAIETSQRTGGVALRDGAAVHVEPLATSSRHDDDLMPAIARVFERSGRRPRDLAAVGVSVGPGGFTGLRIAVGTAKMLALVTGCRVVAVPTAHVVARGVDDDPDAAGVHGPITVVLAVKHEAFWAARLERRDGAWHETTRPGPADATTLDLSDLDALVADRYLPATARERCAAAGLRILAPRFEPTACLAVTQCRLEQELTTDAFALAPIYAREPEAKRLWDLRHDDGAGVP